MHQFYLQICNQKEIVISQGAPFDLCETRASLDPAVFKKGPETV